MMVSHVRCWIPGLLSLALLFALSCAGGGGNPIAPPTPGGGSPSDLTPPSGDDGTLAPPTDSSAQGQAASSEQSTALWGVFDVVYDEGTGRFEILPLRGAQFALNILEFLQPPKGDPANLAISLVDASEFKETGRMVLDVTITHPLANPRFVGFDTMGVLIGDASIDYSEDPGVIFAGVDDLRLLNFDGYTRWMNSVEFTDPGILGYLEGKLGTKGQSWTATVNGYKYFAEGLTPASDLGLWLDTEANQALRGAFLPETSNTRIYELQFPMSGGSPSVRFQYAIISHWKGARDDNGDLILEPEIDDFPPEANAPEAVCVKANTTGSTLYYDETAGLAGGDLVILLTIYDWQGMEALGGTGAFNEIHSVGLDSPDGLFSPGGKSLGATALAGTEVASGPNSTTLQLLIEGLVPKKAGENELLIAVYSNDPATYDQNLGSAYPEGARLAAYTRAIVNIGDTAENLAPVIDKIDGPTEVTCWDKEAVYTCVAHDPNPGDTLLYIWEIVPAGLLPLFLGPPSEDNTVTVDWSDNVEYPPDPYQVCWKVFDGKLSAFSCLNVTKLAEGIIVEDITADEDDTNGVFCTNTDALYTAHAQHCNPGTTMFYRWLRGPGDPPVHPDPADLGWTSPSESNQIVYSWSYTEVGMWWIFAEVNDQFGVPAYSPPYIVERIDTPPGDLEPPQGANEVNCWNTDEQYFLTGGEDCDGGEPPDRQWTLTQTPDPPTGGWLSAPNEYFFIDWSVYPIGVYFLWQRAGKEPNWSISDPLEVHRVNTGPDTPEVPTGPMVVDCNETEALYQAGVVGDCEGDPVQREWALTTGTEPPGTGWVPFEGTTFYVDYSQYPTADYLLFQRASDDGSDWTYSEGWPVSKRNAPPDQPEIPAGPAGVTCHDYAAEYQAGPAEDCDVGDVLTRFWGVSFDPEFPPMVWTEFAGDTFFIDWSEFPSMMLYVFQKVSDAEAENVSQSLAVIKTNAAPDVGPPTGPISVDCTDTEAVYEETLMDDCDPFTTLFKDYYLSTDPDTPAGGHWISYKDTSFTLDFSIVAPGDWYLFLRASDGEAEAVGDPLHIIKYNTAPDKPATPDGPSEVDCLTSPAIYAGGPLTDCDETDFLFRYYYLSTDPATPIGGTWIEVLGDFFQVDFTGVVAEQPYYLFQKASDGDLDSISDSFAVVYHNTGPEDPPRPLGKTEVSCANNNEEYDGGGVYDCDSWQELTREWAVGAVDLPPAIGWTEFSGETWAIDWSEYAEGNYYLFQRVYDGFVRAYSQSLPIIVGPPTLVPPDIPSGATDLICDGPIETYDAGDYLVGCPGLDIIREWAFNNVPTAPLAGWIEFDGTTFDVIPLDLGIGNRYLYQRARLDAQVQVSSPLWVVVHPGDLGVPPIPIGPTTVDCNSVAEEYQMGEVTVACPGTTLSRFWRIEDSSGDPLTGWELFIGSSIVVDWTSVSGQDSLRLVQMADDTEHVQISDPLLVDYVNDEPEFLGTITGPTSVNCMNNAAHYECGDVDDCDSEQVLTREWAWNSVNAYPTTGWTLLSGTSFVIDYSSPEFHPGDVYLFQRVSDGEVTVYDPVSLHVSYANTPPDALMPPSGAPVIDCYNLEQTYDAGVAFDCDNTPLTREWALNDTDEPPATGWLPLTGTTFDMDWTGAAPGLWYLFQRVSDGEYTINSPSLEVIVINTGTSIESFTCLQGDGPFDTDGQTTGLAGLDLVGSLSFQFEYEDCDGDPVTCYWAVTTGPESPDYGDPAWNGPVSGDEFVVDLSAYVAEAPANLYVHLGCYDGHNFVALPWNGTINLWQRVWLTTFADSGEMWSEHSCKSGAGSYTWGYDSMNERLRLYDYGAGSSSGVWSTPVAFPDFPMGASGALLSYLNPALAEGFDRVTFEFLKESTCNESAVDIVTGNGCEGSSPELKEFALAPYAPIWGDTWKVGIVQDGLDGCTMSDFWVDWVGVWIKPMS